MSAQRVTLIGGTGFVGTELVFRLAPLVDSVVVLTRRSSRFKAFKVMPNVLLREADVHDRAALTEAVSGSDVVINLVGILNEAGASKQNTFEGAHVGLTETVLGALHDAGIRRYLHMSALGADAQYGSSVYLRTKGLAETAVHNAARNSSLTATIFQPSIIFGERDAFFNRFAGLLKVLPVFPLAVPEARMSPVHIGDVCQAMIGAISNSDAAAHTIKLCGPRDYSLRELVEYTAQAAGMQRRIIGLPDWAARLQAKIMQRVPGKPFSMDNYNSLQTDNVCPENCARQTTSIEAIVPQYLGGNDVRGRLQSRRRHARR